MDEEATVETTFSVWGSDEESVLNKGVGGLDPAHSDEKHVNGRVKARERPALIGIAKKGDSLAGKKCFLSEQTNSSNSSSVSRKKVVQPLKSQPLKMRQPIQFWGSHFQSQVDPQGGSTDGKLLKPNKGTLSKDWAITRTPYQTDAMKSYRITLRKKGGNH